jgi:two-component system response regulator NreC
MNSRPSPPIRIVVADDHSVVRAGLATFLNRHKDLTIVGEADSAAALLERCAQVSPDLAVIDLRMPGDVPEAIRVLCGRTPPIRVVVFSAFDEPADAALAFQAGATGYVLKQSPESDLVDAIRKVRGGGRHVDASVASRVIEDVGFAGAGPKPATIRLSERERCVLQLVARGHTGPEIALELGVRVGTVDSYRHRIRNKLGLKSRAEVTEFVRTFGHWLKK